VRRRLRRLAVDLTPLRHRDFWLLWLRDLVSEAGSQIALVSVFVQVFALTHSAAAVGLVGLVQLVPLAFAALLGGPLAFTPMVSVVSGGAVSVAGVALLAVLAPQLARYRAPVVPASTRVAG
jgi:hypothetical protein